jgi:NADPH:quinone reductase-like Zn-dependent oxidoreductase
MIDAIEVRAHGGPEVLTRVVVDVPPPGPGEVRVRHAALGVNFIDVYYRTGLYKVDLPYVPGHEAAGVVVAVGRGVRGFAPGDRVAYAMPGTGAYATERNLQSRWLVKLPDAIADPVAAAIMLKGLTTQVLLRRTYRVRRGDRIVVHAAAGGLGLIMTQWARHLGATVIAAVGSDEKAAIAREHGAAHTIVIPPEDLAKRVREITGGVGVPVVYDSVGRDTFAASLDCLRPLGLMVSFGNSSGPVPPFTALDLNRRGSLFLTRPTVYHYFARPGDLQRAARELFDVVAAGVVRVRIGQTYALADAAQAHRDLEARRTTGSTVLVP